MLDRYTTIVFCVFITILVGVFYYVYIAVEDDTTVIVAEVPHALTDEECDALIAHSQNANMQPSTVINKNGGSYDLEMNQRNSKTVWFRDEEHAVTQKMAKLASKYTGRPISYQEKSQIVCYNVGGKFDAHYDAQYNSGAANRQYTCLVYLNDDYEGGTTNFTKLDYAVKPEKGKMVVFRNLDGHGKILPDAIHCGTEVRGNHKWICTKWVHNTPL